MIKGEHDLLFAFMEHNDVHLLLVSVLYTFKNSECFTFSFFVETVVIPNQRGQGREWAASGRSLGSGLMQKTQETQVQSLGQEDPLEEEMATHSSTLWKIPWTEEPSGL